MKKQGGITLIALIITIIVMLILVGVTVNVALNGGLFDTAKQATIGMEKAQIEERAEMVKVALLADEITDSNVTADISEYRDRLLEEFEVTEKDTDGNNIVEVNDEYVIIIKNKELDVDVVEKTKTPPKYLLTTKTSAIEGNEIKITLSSTKTWEEYLASRTAELSDDEKEKLAIELILGFYPTNANSKEFYYDIQTVEDIVVCDINCWYDTTYETIAECLEDENVQEEFGTTEKQLYYYWNMNFGTMEENETNEMTKQEIIEIAYTEYINSLEYNKYTMNLRVYVSKDGAEREEIEKGINIQSESQTISYTIKENGTYELIVTTNSGRNFITSEKFVINNI